MNLLRRMKIKYGIAHPLCMLSLLACLILCGFLVFSSTQGNDYVYSSATDDVVEASYEEFMVFGEEIFDTVIRSYSQTVAIGIEPLLAVIIQGLAGLLNAIIGMPLEIESGFFSLPEVFFVAISIYYIGKFMLCFECTRSFTMLTYGEFERIFGYAMMIMISCQNVMKVMYVCEKHKNVLLSVFPGVSIEVVISILVMIIGVGSSFLGILIYYITKTLVLGLQIMQLSISFFPLTSFFFEVLRSSITVIMAVFNLLFPKVGFTFNCAMFVIGIVLLAQTSSSVEYFRVIYIESLLMPYYRFKGKLELLYKDVPAAIRRKCADEAGIIIPVFSMDKFRIGEIVVGNHEKWWMEITETEIHFYKSKIFSSKIESFTFAKQDKKWYFKENWRCLELFDLNGPEENIIKLFKKPERQISFAVSREYEAIFGEIAQKMQAKDYNALKAKLTEERRSYIEKENKAFYAITQ